MTQTYALRPHLDSPAAATVASELLELRGQALTITGDDVTFAGALSLQVLVSARRQWEEDGYQFLVKSASEPFHAACEGLGFRWEDIGGAVSTKSEGVSIT